jgi:glucosamine 6-phosphate synthetase-like amidotransferase/phosphosugar isomerase protein
MEKATAVSDEKIARVKNIGLIEQFLAKLEYSQSLSSTIIARFRWEAGHNRDKNRHLHTSIAGILYKTS